MVSHPHTLFFSVLFAACLLPQTVRSFESISSFFQYLCIFLEMIAPNKLYGILHYALAVSHRANAGLKQEFQLKAIISVIT